MSTARALQNDLQYATDVNVSDQTIRNRLHESGLRVRHSLVGPVLTALHQAGCSSQFRTASCKNSLHFKKRQ